MQNDRDIELARALARRAAAAGGRAYYVGGCVRDWQMGAECKDIDLEVYGIAPAVLRAALSELGEVIEKGASFAVLGLRHTDLDVAMPRTERRTGEGHRDFDISVDPFLTTREASRRRDFTINAMMQDVLTREIIDHWNGRADLAGKRIRAVSADTFGEDALRAFRAAQFAARFEAVIEPDTLALCRNMRVEALAGERILEETKKALLKASRPSLYFQALRDMDHLKEFFPELAATIGVPQNPTYHPEGDVFEHTMLVLDAAAALRSRAREPLYFMFSALTHDLGKCVATRVDERGRITSIGHEIQGLPLVERQLRRLTGETNLIRYARNMAELHMRPNMLAVHRSHKKKTRAMFDLSLCPEDLILLSRADASGKLDAPYDPGLEAFLQERLQDYRQCLELPMVTGQDLRAAGVAPGPVLGKMLHRGRMLHFAGLSRERALSQLLAERGIGKFE